MSDYDLSFGSKNTGAETWTIRIAKVFLFAAFIVVLSLRGSHGAMRAEDATILFNYYNGVTPNVPLFYYSGYVSALPSLIAYTISGASLQVQFATYLVSAILVGTVFAFQVDQLLRKRIGPTAAFSVSLLILAIVHLSLSHSFFGLVYGTWIMALSVCLFYCKAIDRAQSSWISFFYIALCAASSPTVLALLPFAIILLGITRGRNIKLVSMTVFIVTYYGIVLALNPGKSSVSLSAAEKIAFIGLQLHSLRAITIVDFFILILGAIFLIKLCVELISDPSSRTDTSKLVCVCLLMYGFGVFSLYILSSRFTSENLFSPRFTMPLHFGVALSFVVLFAKSRFAIPQIIAPAAIFLCFGYLASKSIVTNAIDVSNRFAFVRNVDAWRKDCSSNAANTPRVFDPTDDWSLALACTKTAVMWKPGFHSMTAGGLDVEPSTQITKPSAYIGAPFLAVKNKPN